MGALFRAPLADAREIVLSRGKRANGIAKWATLCWCARGIDDLQLANGKFSLHLNTYFENDGYKGAL